MNENDRAEIIAKIAASIETHGYHLRIVEGGPLPRFAYTIGLLPSYGCELVLAGCALFTNAEIGSIARIVAKHLGGDGGLDSSVAVEGMGEFSLRKVDNSWSASLLLGVQDFFKCSDVKPLQVVPDKNHWTVDVPEMGRRLAAEEQPIWRWIQDDWNLPISRRAMAITNVDALQGYAITEVVRWEESEWEMFSGAGTEVARGDIRKVPLAVLLGFDDTLRVSTDLEIGEGVWREKFGSEWHSWRKRGCSGANA